MSVRPFQVPMRDFMRSNSGEPGFCLVGSSALRQKEPARSNVAQTEVSLVFIMFISFWLLSDFHLYNERGAVLRTAKEKNCPRITRIDANMEPSRSRVNR